jgi:hypothetical protein
MTPLNWTFRDIDDVNPRANTHRKLTHRLDIILSITSQYLGTLLYALTSSRSISNQEFFGSNALEGQKGN